MNLKSVLLSKGIEVLKVHIFFYSTFKGYLWRSGRRRLKICYGTCLFEGFLDREKSKINNQ